MPSHRSTRTKKNFYAVTKADNDGNRGIYTDWTNCSKTVLHVSGARQEGTQTLEQAIQLLQMEGLVSPKVFHKGKCLTLHAYYKQISGDIPHEEHNEINVSHVSELESMWVNESMGLNNDNMTEIQQPQVLDLDQISDDTFVDMEKALRDEVLPIISPMSMSTNNTGADLEHYPNDNVIQTDSPMSVVTNNRGMDAYSIAPGTTPEISGNAHVYEQPADPAPPADQLSTSHMAELDIDEETFIKKPFTADPAPPADQLSTSHMAELDIDEETFIKKPFTVSPYTRAGRTVTGYDITPRRYSRTVRTPHRLNSNTCTCVVNPSQNGAMISTLNNKITILETTLVELLQAQKDQLSMLAKVNEQLQNPGNSVRRYDMSTQTTLNSSDTSAQTYIQSTHMYTQTRIESCNIHTQTSGVPTNGSTQTTGESKSVSTDMSIMKQSVTPTPTSSDTNPQISIYLSEQVSQHDEDVSAMRLSRDADVDEQTNMSMQACHTVMSTPHMDSSPDISEEDHMNDHDDSQSLATEGKSDWRTVKDSHFLGHCAKVYNMRDISKFMDQVKEDQLPSHNIVSYSIPSINSDDTQLTTCHDDGERGAGGHLLRLIQNNKLKDIVIVVQRWYGGTHLGQERFKHIVEVAHEALVNMGEIIEDVSTLQQRNLIPTIQTHRQEKKQVESTNKMNNNTEEKVDNVIIHDSTGNNIVTEQMYKQDQTIKIWAPYLDKAIKAISDVPIAVKNIILICGIRHARQILESSASLNDIKEGVNNFILAAKSRSPGATITIASLLPSNDKRVNDEVINMNLIYKETAIQHGAVYCDSHGAYLQKNGVLRDGHPTKSSVALLVYSLKAAQRQQNVRRSQYKSNPPRLNKNRPTQTLSNREAEKNSRGNASNQTYVQNQGRGAVQHGNADTNVHRTTANQTYGQNHGWGTVPHGEADSKSHGTAVIQTYGQNHGRGPTQYRDADTNSHRTTANQTYGQNHGWGAVPTPLVTHDESHMSYRDAINNSGTTVYRDTPPNSTHGFSTHQPQAQLQNLQNSGTTVYNQQSQLQNPTIGMTWRPNVAAVCQSGAYGNQHYNYPMYM